MPSPLHVPHSRMDKMVFRWLDGYAEHTPGTEAFHGVSTLLGNDSEVQPDAVLMTVAGSSVHQPIADVGPVIGAPELVVEIAASTAPIDLFEKRALYEREGVWEYLVILVRKPERVLWFVRRREQFEELNPGGDGLFRSEVFPGLGLDPAALLQGNSARVREVVEQGLATAEHTDFVQQLGSAHSG